MLPTSAELAEAENALDVMKWTSLIQRPFINLTTREQSALVLSPDFMNQTHSESDLELTQCEQLYSKGIY